jgi:small subunit ribosomal protein S8
MVTTDPIADFLTRIRNALIAKHDTVTIPFSKMKHSITNVLLEEGYITSAEIIDDENAHKQIFITLKYGAKYERVITNLKRISKPGLRIYCSCEDMPKVLDGLGIAIVSTSKGVMTDKNARKSKVGGEVLAYVW